MPGLFHKPFRVKSHAKMKSSERRQFLEDLRRHFPGLATAAAGGDADTRLLAGDRRCDLFKSKIVNHAEQTGHLYFAAGQPIFYEFDSVLCPTVYALWRLPELAAACDGGGPKVLRVTVPDSLLPVLQNGADLMAPGLIDGWQTMAQGDICCLCCREMSGNGVYAAVGRAAASGADLLANERRGRAVLIDHVLGDQLWLRGDRSAPPSAPAAVSAPAPTLARHGEGEADTEATVVNGEAVAGGVASEPLSEAMSTVAIGYDQDGGGGGDGSGASDSEDGAESITRSADAHLLNCLLHSLLHKVRDKDLPLLCSSLLANFMSRYSPVPLSLKATSYKKFGAFVQAMREDGLLELSNEKGVLAVVSVNRRHPLLQTDPLPVLAFAELESDASREATASLDGPAAIEDALFVTAASGELFKRWGHFKGSCLTPKQVRQLVTEYVKAEGLQTPNRPGEVTLDALLSRLAAQSGRPVLTDSVAWETLFQVCCACMTSGYRALGRDGSVLLERRGPAPRVTLRVESRAAGKSVSLLAGLPDFGVDPTQFAKRVQRALSVSAGAAGVGGEVQVQGDQLAYLFRLLTEEYAISKKYIQGFTPSGKKKSAKGKGKGKT